ncbi:DNA repair protein RAD18 (SMC family protein) [Pseudoloma neurophilia]|uniref:DNA repair protein RAD18 (SMC family protein) n=1 Tax=Pseudoloma neurophilia TaxID=146866 RepID=A0A0R0M2L7_9MICR|nr:DNA repair protein RAD18 (SMC family protein) [Pseudoloma neurophilia]
MADGNLIKSITLNNFMCHTNLQVNFTKSITVIGGFNGSGKSAIMIAIGVVFGLKQSKLERGTSLKSLILNGKTTAKITIVLNNEKVRLNYAFFGPEIIIEKTIRQTGVSTMRIVGENNKTFSTKKNDLEYILDNFQLHIDNPLNFQTQENSKKFLKNTDPSTLYELFMKGTELDDITSLHEESRQKNNEMKEKLDNLNIDLSQIEKRRNETARNLNIVLEGAKLDDEIIKLKRELEWSKLFKINEERKNKIEEINKWTIEMEKEREKIKNNSTQMLQFQQEEYEKENEIANLKNTFEIRKRKLNDEIRTFNNDFQEMQNDLGIVLQEIKEKEDRLKHLRKIGGFDSYNEKLFELKQEKEHNNFLKKQLEEKTQELHVEENHWEETQKRLEDLRIKERNITSQINYIKNLSQDRLSFFHSNMKNILSDIEKTTWKQEVIGPIGIFLKLKDMRWQKPLSVILKNVLSNFIVFNREDKFELQKIFAKYKTDFAIIIPSRSENELIYYQKVNDQLVALNVLEITHPKKYIIINHLIISCGLERILLIKDREIAFNTLKKEASEPRKFVLNTAYLTSGDKIEFRAGYLSDSRPKFGQMYFEHSEERLKTCIAQRDQVLVEIRTLSQRDKTKDLKISIEDINSDLRVSNLKIDDLKIATSFQPSNDLDGDIAKLKAEIADATQTKDEMEANIKEVSNKKFLAEKELKENNQSLPEHLQNFGKKINALKMENNILHQKISSISDKIRSKRNEEQNLSTIFASKSSVLEETIPMIEDARPEKTVLENIRELEVKKEIFASLEKQETLQSDLKELNEMYDYKFQIIEKYKKSITKTIESIKKRIEKREELKLSTAAQIRQNFKQLTAKRNYEGDLLFNHDEKKIELKMKVSIKAGDKNTLSGGERSYAAMCLILSIWPFIACPVKILDEFDVFMDSLNRDTILKELISLFEESGLQIILITPLSLNLQNVDSIMLKHPSREA